MNLPRGFSGQCLFQLYEMDLFPFCSGYALRFAAKLMLLKTGQNSAFVHVRRGELETDLGLCREFWTKRSAIIKYLG